MSGRVSHQHLVEVELRAVLAEQRRLFLTRWRSLIAELVAA